MPKCYFHCTGKPDPPIVDPSNIKATAISVTVKWKPGFDGGRRQTFTLWYSGNGGTWIEDNIPDLGHGQTVTQKVTQGIQPEAEYKFEVWASNEYGASAPVPWNTAATPGT